MISELGVKDSAILVRELSKEISNELKAGKYTSLARERRSTSDNGVLGASRAYRPHRRIPSRGF